MKNEKMDMRELNLSELEQASGGCIWCLAAVAVIAAVGYGTGRLAAYQMKNGK